YSFLSSYCDAGYTGVYVGTSAEWTREVVEVIRGELARVARDGLAPDELLRAKNQMKGSLLLGLETSDSRMSRIAKNEIYFGRDGLTVLNAPGTIDADYRGEVRVLLVNLGRAPVSVRRGDRIAQLVVGPVARVTWREVAALPESKRGDGGFGSTGDAQSRARLRRVRRRGSEGPEGEPERGFAEPGDGVRGARRERRGSSSGARAAREH